MSKFKPFWERITEVERIINKHAQRLGLSTMMASPKRFVVFQGSPTRVYAEIFADDPDIIYNDTLKYYLDKHMDKSFTKTERILESKDIAVESAKPITENVDNQPDKPKRGSRSLLKGA